MLQFDPAVAKALFTEGADATVEIEEFKKAKGKKKEMSLLNQLATIQKV